MLPLGLSWTPAVEPGDHARPRVSRPAPSPVGLLVMATTKRCITGLQRVVGEGANHCTRGARAPRKLRILWALGGVMLLTGASTLAAEYDVVVYGGTSAGVIAAVQAKKLGKSVIVVSPDKHLGGLSSGGLGFTDTGNKAVIGGLSRDFYHRVWQEYQKPETWRWQKREQYGN